MHLYPIGGYGLAVIDVWMSSGSLVRRHIAGGGELTLTAGEGSWGKWDRWVVPRQIRRH